MLEPAKKTKQVDRSPDTNMLGLTFDPAYVEGVVKPFFLSSKYEGEPPLLPMIDVALSKEAATPPNIFGMLYDNWTPNPEEEGVTVFLRGYDELGPNNERKRIYFSACHTGVWTVRCYSDKIKHFLEALFNDQNEGKPLMQRYYQEYYDLYWDLHLGVRGKDIPTLCRAVSRTSKGAVLWGPIGVLLQMSDTKLTPNAPKEKNNDR